jgi:hypothetical protein
MKDDLAENSSKLENKLTYIFSNINEWLKFAEVKNAALIAFLIAAISGLLGFMASFQQLHQSLKIGIFFCVVSLIVSCIISLLSFAPKVNRLEIIYLHKKGEILDSDNLLFFCNLAKYDANTLASKIADKYFAIELPNPPKIYTDITEQIIINSKIATAKFRFFKIALNFVFLAISSLLVVSSIHFLFLS